MILADRSATNNPERPFFFVDHHVEAGFDRRARRGSSRGLYARELEFHRLRQFECSGIRAPRWENVDAMVFATDGSVEVRVDSVGLQHVKDVRASHPRVEELARIVFGESYKDVASFTSEKRSILSASPACDPRKLEEQLDRYEDELMNRLGFYEVPAHKVIVLVCKTVPDTQAAIRRIWGLPTRANNKESKENNIQGLSLYNGVMVIPWEFPGSKYELQIRTETLAHEFTHITYTSALDLPRHGKITANL